MKERLIRLLEIRYRISTQLYFGIGVAVALTIGASLVGWFSFNQVGDAQNRVNEGSVPELAAAFGVAQFSGELVNAAPRLSAAETRESFSVVVSSIDESRDAFEAELAVLQGSKAERFDRIRADAETLFSNIEAIKEDRLALFDLAERKEVLRRDIERVTLELNSYLGPAIDDQLFYTVTGYRVLGEPPAPRSEHFSQEQVERYRQLAELQVDANIATQLLADALNLSDVSLVEALRERFESAAGRIERNLATQSAAFLPNEIFPVFVSLSDLGGQEIRIPERRLNIVAGLSEGNEEQQTGFDLVAQELRLGARQQDLLDNNRGLAVALLSEINELVGTAQASAQEATASSTQAISTGRTLLLVISGISIAGAVLIVWVLVGRVLLRRLEMLSDWMRRMAGGDLEARVEIGGRDEVADMAAALEVFRRHALEVQRLNLVEKLAEDLQSKNDELEVVLADLERAQDQIVVREKLAALGQLTAGVAHEIKNPLNFVKNFSEVSEELIKELTELVDDLADSLTEDQQSYIKEIAQDLTGNLERIRNHGDRANRIVQDMLMMGRGSGGFQPTDINRLLDEHARLAYHSARATDPDFNLDLKQDMDEELGEIEVIPQDLGRVFLNLVGNACDATDEKRRDIESGAGAEGGYETDDGGRYFPTVWLTTKRGEEHVQIRIRDNGKGMPPEVMDKIFNPFFTTKPTDRGTGLGLAISSDIVRKHGGEISVESEAGRYTEMLVELPLTPPPGAAEAAAGEAAGAAQSS